MCRVFLMIRLLFLVYSPKGLYNFDVILISAYIKPQEGTIKLRKPAVWLCCEKIAVKNLFIHVIIIWILNFINNMYNSLHTVFASVGFSLYLLIYLDVNLTSLSATSNQSGVVPLILVANWVSPKVRQDWPRVRLEDILLLFKKTIFFRDIVIRFFCQKFR